MQINCTEERVSELLRTFATLSRTLQMAQFISLEPEAQEATLAEAHALMFGQCVPFTVKRQLLEFLKVLETCPKVGEKATAMISKSLTEWNNPPF